PPFPNSPFLLSSGSSFATPGYTDAADVAQWLDSTPATTLPQRLAWLRCHPPPQNWNPGDHASMVTQVRGRSIHIQISRQHHVSCHPTDSGSIPLDQVRSPAIRN